MAENLDIPDFLKRTGKPPVKKEAPMADVSNEAPKPDAPKAKPIKGAAKPASTAKADVDAYGYRTGSLKAKAAAMYAAKGGATLAEVKAALGSVQLNLLKDLEGRGFTVTRVKEPVEGKRPITRYHLTVK